MFLSAWIESRMGDCFRQGLEQPPTITMSLIDSRRLQIDERKPVMCQSSCSTKWNPSRHRQTIGQEAANVGCVNLMPIRKLPVSSLPASWRGWWQCGPFCSLITGNHRLHWVPAKDTDYWTFHPDRASPSTRDFGIGRKLLGYHDEQSLWNGWRCGKTPWLRFHRSPGSGAKYPGIYEDGFKMTSGDTILPFKTEGGWKTNARKRASSHSGDDLWRT